MISKEAIPYPKALRNVYVNPDLAPKVLGRKKERETFAASSASLHRGIVAALSAELLEIAATSAFQHYYYSHPPK
jgi:hypothetical protein